MWYNLWVMIDVTGTWWYLVHIDTGWLDVLRGTWSGKSGSRVFTIKKCGDSVGFLSRNLDFKWFCGWKSRALSLPVCITVWIITGSWIEGWGCCSGLRMNMEMTLMKKSNRQALRGSKCCYTEPAFLHVFPVISCDIHYYPLSCRLQPFVSLGTHLDLQDTCQVELTCCHLLVKYGKVKGWSKDPLW